MTQRDAFKFTAFDFNSGLQYWLLAGITLLALILRFYKLGEWSFWIDEIFTVNRAQIHYSTLEDVSRNIPPAGLWLPLSLLATSGTFTIFGVSEWSARLVPSLIGVLSIPILYSPTKKLFGPGVALIAALLLGVSPWHLYWSQNARFYTALLLFYALASFAFFYGIERDRPAYLALFAGLFYLAASERLLAALLGPVVLGYLILVWLLPFEKPAGFRLRNLLLLAAPGLAFGLFELYSIVRTGSSTLLYVFDVFAGQSIDSPLRLLIVIFFNIGIPVVSLAFFSGIYLVWQKSRIGLLLFLSAVVPPLVLAAINPYVFIVDRYAFMVLPFWIILGAVGVVELFRATGEHRMLLAAGVLALLLVDAAGNHLLYYQINHGNRPDWRSAFYFIEERKSDGDVIVSAVENIGDYYLAEDIMPLADIDPIAIRDGTQRYWFVIDSENGWWSGAQKQWVETNSSLVEAWYLRTRENMHIRVYFYDPANPSTARNP